MRALLEELAAELPAEVRIRLWPDELHATRDGVALSVRVLLRDGGYRWEWDEPIAGDAREVARRVTRVLGLASPGRVGPAHAACPGACPGAAYPGAGTRA